MNVKNRFVWLIAVFVIACSPIAPVQTISAEKTQTPTALEKILADKSTKPLPTTSQTAQGNQPEKVFLPTVIAPSVTAPPTDTPFPGSGFTADHTVINRFDDIPVTALQAASAIPAVFFHQSTGGYITAYGFKCLAGQIRDANGYPECVQYETSPNYYDRSKWNWTKQWEIADAAAKVAAFEDLVPQFQSRVDVIGMKFCYVDGWNQDFEIYRTAMEKLERDYPGKIFIWSTSALWADPEAACATSNPFNGCKAIAEFNQQLRAYAATNNKLLYDIAAIESNGGQCQVAGYEGLCQEYYSDGGGHPNMQGSIRLAKGFWWLMARVSGWDGKP